MPIPRWRKSSHSAGAQNCVELAIGPAAAVRDSKNPTRALAFPASALRELLNSARG